MIRLARVAVLAPMLALVLVGAEVAELARLPFSAAFALAFARLGHRCSDGSVGFLGRFVSDGTTAPANFSTRALGCWATGGKTVTPSRCPNAAWPYYALCKPPAIIS